MRVFVGEYVCGGGLLTTPEERVPHSLRKEGAAMLHAVSADLAEVATVCTPLDPRLGLQLDRRVECAPVFGAAPLWSQWIRHAATCDVALVIAPETGGILAQAVAMLRAAGVDVLSGSGDFLRAASDKLETARVLAIGSVRHPPTWNSSMPPQEFPPGIRRWVVKPRDGCGTEDIQTFPAVEQAFAAAEQRGCLVQPWIEGTPVSIAMVVAGGEHTILPAVGQEIDLQTCGYAGGCGPLSEDAQRRATVLAQCALAAMPPTARGFVGLDLILGDDPRDDCVLEVNPRLTTSYVGLRRIIEGNLAARLIGKQRGPVRCAVAPDAVRWTADGQVWVEGEPVEPAAVSDV